MTRLMYDSVSPNSIPRNAEMVLGYVDGIYVWTQEEWALFPNAVHVTCSAIGVVQADVYDVEPGCIWPMGNVMPLVERDWNAGLEPAVYINQHNHWLTLRRMFQQRYGREPLWHLANYDGDPSIPDGAVAKQYAHPAEPLGSAPSGPWELPFHADVSAVQDYWPGVDERPPGGGQAEERERMYSFDVQEIPATAGVESEVDITWPPIGGATGIAYVWVSAQVPAGAELRVKYAHWNDAYGVRLDGEDALNYVEDGAIVYGPMPLYGKRAPKGAAKLVLVYESTRPVKFAVEVTD